ncbi:MAG: helix-hairpin-helix domain-containing protein, partial [Planctomycetia bacterium]|nr:helix-hairpin-helix domain-containing protein [Planctomycetia bacterium]
GPYRWNENHTVQVDPQPVSQTRSTEQINSSGKSIAPRESKLYHVEINTASVAEFRQLPGIGPTLAKTIVAWREEHGPFQKIEDIKLVPGIGPKKYDVLKAFIFVEQPVPAEPAANGTSHE